MGWEITQGLAKSEFSTPPRTHGEKKSLVVQACNSCMGMPETGPCSLLACQSSLFDKLQASEIISSKMDRP